MFDNDTRLEIRTIAGRLGVEEAALLAVAEVESGGKAFALVNGRREPLIRFEGHYFDRRLSGAKREAARAAGLADPKAGAVKNPTGQAARWRLLDKATAIDRKAALESVSWGLGQVMGAHWQWLGYADVDALVAEARQSVGGQVALMARYIDKADLAAALRNRDWAAFAKGYNGPDYARHGYHTKIAAAYARYLGKDPADPGAAPDTFLRRGSRGDAVRRLQTRLSELGLAVAIDGMFGPETDTAVRTFQSNAGLDADGIVGPRTVQALDLAARSAQRSLLARLWQWISGLWRDG